MIFEQLLELVEEEKLVRKIRSTEIVCNVGKDNTNYLPLQFQLSYL
jgi:hypothetical protein